MSDLFRDFLDQFRATFGTQFPIEITDSQLKISGNPDFGDLLVLDHEDEITLEVGKYYHGHFTPNSNHRILEEDSVLRTISDLLEFIKQVANGNIALRLTYWGTHLVIAETISLQERSVTLSKTVFPLEKLKGLFKPKTYRYLTWK